MPRDIDKAVELLIHYFGVAGVDTSDYVVREEIRDAVERIVDAAAAKARLEGGDQ